MVLVIGIAIGGSGEEELKKEVATLEQQVDHAQKETEEAGERELEAQEEASAIRGERSEIIGEAESKADKILSGAKQESDDAEARLGSLRSEVDSTENELANVEGSLEGAEETQAKSSIPGDGTFKSEVDYIPGTYRSEGGSGCYWATLNSADPYDIASNENATGPTIASITSPYFQTSGCGTWERIGE